MTAQNSGAKLRIAGKVDNEQKIDGFVKVYQTPCRFSKIRELCPPFAWRAFASVCSAIVKSNLFGGPESPHYRNERTEKVF
ncbi:MAG: hypothetical protein DYG98_20535 [Haliscomenobacteraceae bacterium CHB4]|nr:hypothetical protein [Haliscomenobacteraceae bacterium CHB4]